MTTKSMTLALMLYLLTDGGDANHHLVRNKASNRSLNDLISGSFIDMAQMNRHLLLHGIAHVTRQTKKRYF